MDAGPGTGKTATAAGRIAALTGRGLAPQTLWTISFSRAAVGEMRQRLILLAGQDIDPGQVTTLDSMAWSLRGDGEDDGMVLEGHDRAIEETLAAVRMGDMHVRQRLAAIRHLTIDEAQDLVGVRALLVVALLEALPEECGVTILTDEAQAIYGFSAGALASAFTADTVAAHLLDKSYSPYRLHRLTQVHRTGDRRLLRLFAAARIHALKEAANPRRKLQRIRRSIAWRAHGRQKTADDAATLILYRSRAEVLTKAQAMFEAGLPFRLRLSGLPVMLAPWLAQTLGDFDGAVLPRWQFEDLWAERVGHGHAHAGWNALAHAVGEPRAERVRMGRMLQILATSHPPSELCRFDPGNESGPIVGTIHASKGREMERVRLMLPSGKGGRDDPDAEARVLFVAATRAKRRLEIGKGPRLDARRLSNGRVYVPVSISSARIEIGRAGDFDWLFGGEMDASGLESGEALQLIFTNGSLAIGMNKRILGTATPALMTDLGEIKTRLAGPPDYRAWAAQASDIAVLGLHTSVAGKRGTGLLLTPAVCGLPLFDFHAI